MTAWLPILLTLLSLLSVLAGRSQNQSICSQKLDLSSTEKCCKLPLVNLNSYEKKCGTFEIKVAHDWPCTFNCIYKAAGAINGTHLVMDKLGLMLDGFFEGHPELSELFKQSFSKCSAFEEELVKNLNKRHFATKVKCSPLAMLYGICAFKHVFIGCPEPYWTNSTHCNRVRACELSRSV